MPVVGLGPVGPREFVTLWTVFAVPRIARNHGPEDKGAGQ
jgi:hypothetical protein